MKTWIKKQQTCVQLINLLVIGILYVSLVFKTINSWVQNFILKKLKYWALVQNSNMEKKHIASKSTLASQLTHNLH